MSRATSREDIELLLVDGDNVLHEVRGDRDQGAVAWLLPRLLLWRPEGVRIVVAFDGHSAPGESSRRRVTHGIEFYHSGSRSADDLLIELLSARPYAARAHTAVVTRDRALTDRARQAGGVTRSVDWLIGQLEGDARTGRSIAASARPVGIGQSRTLRRSLVEPSEQEHGLQAPWQPGRGATRKRGNPRRGAKASRQR